MNRNIIWIIALFLIVSVSAEQVFKQNENVNFKVPCYNNNTYCSTAAKCNITIQSPTTVAIANNVAMTNSYSYHNITITPTSFGTYSWDVVCVDGTVRGYGQGTFKVNPSGYPESSPGTLSYLGMMFGIVALICIFLFLSTRFNSEGAPLKVSIINIIIKTFFMLLSYACSFFLLAIPRNMVATLYPQQAGILTMLDVAIQVYIYTSFIILGLAFVLAAQAIIYNIKIDKINKVLREQSEY